MNILRKTKLFFRDEDGAVCVDWVVLAVAVAGIAISVLATVGPVPLEASSTRVGHVAAQPSPSNPTFP